MDQLSRPVIIVIHGDVINHSPEIFGFKDIEISFPKSRNNYYNLVQPFPRGGFPKTIRYTFIPGNYRTTKAQERDNFYPLILTWIILFFCSGDAHLFLIN